MKLQLLWNEHGAFEFSRGNEKLDRVAKWETCLANWTSERDEKRSPFVHSFQWIYASRYRDRHASYCYVDEYETFFKAETSIKLSFFRNIVYSIKTIFTVTYFKNVTGEKESQNDLYYSFI